MRRREMLAPARAAASASALQAVPAVPAGPADLAETAAWGPLRFGMTIDQAREALEAAGIDCFNDRLPDGTPGLGLESPEFEGGGAYFDKQHGGLGLIVLDHWPQRSEPDARGLVARIEERRGAPPSGTRADPERSGVLLHEWRVAGVRLVVRVLRLDLAGDAMWRVREEYTRAST
ncbi:MAG: hypothetical protein JXB32_11530 [Deltaproteobacteria bacterium]|nr:hypothetical protein [Deltaproteobacteria bacterium]